MFPDLVAPSTDFCDRLPGGGIVSAGCKTVTDLPGSISDAAMNWVEERIAETAATFAKFVLWVMSHVVEMALNTTTPTVDQNWFANAYERIWWPAAIVALIVLVIVLGWAGLTRNGGSVGRALVMIPVAFIGAGAAPVLVQGLSDVAELMTAHVTSAMATDAEVALNGLATSLAKTAAIAPGMPVFGGLVLTLLSVVGGVAVWLELALRGIAIAIGTYFLPILLVGLVSERLRGITSKILGALIVVIFSKFIIAAALALGLTAMAHASAGVGAANTMLVGAGVLLLAAFLTPALFKVLGDLDGSAFTTSRREAGRVTGASQTSSASQTAIRNAIRNHSSGGRHSAPRAGQSQAAAGQAASRGSAGGSAAAGPAAAAVVAAQGAQKAATHVKTRAENTTKGNS